MWAGADGHPAQRGKDYIGGGSHLQPENCRGPLSVRSAPCTCSPPPWKTTPQKAAGPPLPALAGGHTVREPEVWVMECWLGPQLHLVWLITVGRVLLST